MASAMNLIKIKSYSFSYNIVTSTCNSDRINFFPEKLGTICDRTVPENNATA